MSGQPGYDPAFFDTLDAVEDRHFWFRARRRAVAAILRQVTASLPDGYRVLELGCGNGGMLRLLRDSCPGGKVVGMDLYEEGLRHARRRCDCALVRGDVRQPPFHEAFAIVGLFDVLEHVADDAAMLEHVHRLLTPAGAVILTVPAHMSLWSYFDVAAHHARRYAPCELHARLEEAGFVVEYLTQFMGAIYPLVWLGRRIKQVVGRSRDAVEMTQDDLRITPGLNELLGFVLAGEAEQIRHRRRLTRGTSLLALARKRRDEKC
jgi:ubiquinone/menaquinone biosynthesis C-methylase UbiE